MRILVVEDDPTLAAFVSKGLGEAGYAVDVAADGARGLDSAATNRPDLAIIDIMLPGMDGFSVVEAIRRRGLPIPVIVLSARRSVDDRVKGLQIGADDYLTKPFAFRGTLARVHALLRRSVSSNEPSHLDVADLHIDLFPAGSREAARRLTSGHGNSRCSSISLDTRGRSCRRR